MCCIRKLHIPLFSIVLFLTFSCYESTVGYSTFTSPDNIERIARVIPTYKRGNCHFNLAVTANKNCIPERYLHFNTEVFLKANAILIFTKHKMQSKLAYLTIKPINNRILRLACLYKDIDFYHYLLG